MGVPAIIEIKGLHHVYRGHEGDTHALGGVDIQIDEGEFVAIIGRNGSGKSTLAKHLNAILLPTAGRVRVLGMDTQDAELLWNIRQAVGMVFQNPDNQIVATVIDEDVAFGPENLGVPTPEIADRVEAALRQVNMLPYRRHAPHLLSGGQKQRVAMAGVLAMHPKVLVLDEATAMLDPVGRAEVIETILALRSSAKMTTVLITHHMDEAVLAHRVIVMDEGRVITTGTPTQVFAQPELLESLGLDVPLAAKLAKELIRSGLSLPEGILTAAQLVNALCQSA